LGWSDRKPSDYNALYNDHIIIKAFSITIDAPLNKFLMRNIFQKLMTILYWSSISFIVLWFLSAAIFKILFFEFTDQTVESQYIDFRFNSLLVAILFTLTGTLKKTDSAFYIVGKILLTMTATAIVIFFLVLSIWTDCTWITNETIFLNKETNSQRIVSRSKGCLLVSGKLTEHFFIITPITNYLISAVEVDTSRINKSEWQKLKD
jgi:hypothetical protein